MLISPGMKKNLYTLMLIFGFILCHAQVIILEGRYVNKNLFIQNPYSGKAFCTDKVLVNGKEVAFAAESAFELKLNTLGYQAGDSLRIEIFHKADCKPKVLMDNSTPRHDLPVIDLSVDSNGVLRWQTKAETSTGPVTVDSILKIEMELSAFGVEADDVPSITAYLDFSKDSSHCVKSFYNPAYKGSGYALSKTDMKTVLQLLKTADLSTLKSQYTTDKTDQPRSKLVIYTTRTKYSIDDYGLVGGYPLRELYKIVYKL
jgi:hypothetical protein